VAGTHGPPAHPQPFLCCRRRPPVPWCFSSHPPEAVARVKALVRQITIELSVVGVVCAKRVYDSSAVSKERREAAVGVYVKCGGAVQHGWGMGSGGGGAGRW